MPQINKVVVTTTYTRPNTDLPWHEFGVDDPYLSNLQQQIVALRWSYYANQKSVERNNPNDLTFIIRFTWHNEVTYNEYKALPMTIEYEPLLVQYYQSKGGNVTETVEVLKNDFLST